VDSHTGCAAPRLGDDGVEEGCEVEQRLERIKARLFEEYYQKKQWWGDDLSIFDDDPTLSSRPLVVRKALAIQKVCREMPIEIKEDELIVGICTMSSVGFGHTFPRYETDEEAEAAARVCLNRKSVWGHHNPYYPKVLERGLDSIREEARARKAKVPASDQGTRDWYDAVALALESAAILAERYAKLAEYLAEEAPSQERAVELREIARICRKVPMKPAESFHEALQSAWFVHAILQSTLNYTSIGRTDQYLWPFYKKDLEAGKITRSQARERLGSFLVKFNERVQLNNDHIEDHFTFGDWSQGGDPNLETTHLKMSNDMDYTYGQSQNHWLQNTIVSGLTPEGKDGTNELSHMIIDLVNELELIDPLVSVRLHQGSPEAIIETTARWLAKGGAQPTVFNDEVIVDGMVKFLGIPVEDARDYSNDGCWEAIPYGRTEFGYGHIEVLLSLESTLNRGKSLLNGNPIGPDSGPLSAFQSFEQLYAAFKEQVRNRIDLALENKLQYYDEVHKIAPVPFLSALVEDCLEKGKDMTQRGARYRLYSPLLTGFSHCVDSLAVIKKVVFEEKRVSLEELADALRNDWKGQERLRQYCLNKVPKYGNDDDYADSIGVDFLQFYCDYFDEWNRKIDLMILAPGIGTFENYPRLGYVCGASADGRKAQAPLASNYSPSFGVDRNGPTAVMRSATKFDLSRLNDGCPVDLRMSFSDSNGQGAVVLKDYIKSFLRLGGNILTISKVSTETLKAAQREPEKYASLRVRLGGLTAYFVQLCETQQNEFIRRTEHGF
jgi:pyruvate-formate lyase